MIKVLYSVRTRVPLLQLFSLLVILFTSSFLLSMIISSYLAKVLQEFVYSGMDISSVSCILAGVGGPTRM